MKSGNNPSHHEQPPAPPQTPPTISNDGQVFPSNPPEQPPAPPQTPPTNSNVGQQVFLPTTQAQSQTSQNDTNKIPSTSYIFLSNNQHLPEALAPNSQQPTSDLNDKPSTQGVFPTNPPPPSQQPTGNSVQTQVNPSDIFPHNQKQTPTSGTQGNDAHLSSRLNQTEQPNNNTVCSNESEKNAPKNKKDARSEDKHSQERGPDSKSS